MRRRDFIAGGLALAATPADAQFAIFQVNNPTGGFGAPQLQVAGVFAPTNRAFTTDQVQNFYVPGNESPALSTADYYLTNSTCFLRPYDLDAMGTPGATVKANNSNNRYVWVCSSDHPTGGDSIHTDSWGMMVGFSSDPGILPSALVNTIPPVAFFTGDATTPGLNGIAALWDWGPSSLVYNPDDASFPFYVYTQGTNPPSWGLQSIMWKSTNMFDWQGGAWGPADIQSAALQFDQLTSIQYVRRRGVNDWVTLGTIGSLGRSNMGSWTSTDGKTFSYAGSTTYNVTGFPSVNLSIDAGSVTPNRLTASSAIFSPSDTGKNVTLYDGASNPNAAMSFQKVNYVSPTQVDLTSFYPPGSDFTSPPTPTNSSYYGVTFTNEAAPFQMRPAVYRAGPPPSALGGLSIYGTGGGCLNDPFTSGTQLYQVSVEDARHNFQPTDDGLWITVVPIDANFNVSQSVPAIRVSSRYDGAYPGPGYLQAAMSYQEDGISHIYGEIGYPGPHATGYSPFPGAQILGSVSGATLTVSSLVGGVGHVPLGAFVSMNNQPYLTVGTVSSGGPGGAGTYTITNANVVVVPLTIGSALGNTFLVGSNAVAASISGTTLTVTSSSGTINNGDAVKIALVLGQIIGAVTGAGGTGTYTIDNYGVTIPANTPITINAGAAAGTGAGTASNGYFGQQFIDYYTIAYDSAAASDAAPFGVSASCSSNTVTISWMKTPLGPGAKSQSYNLYRGTTGPPTTVPGTQSTFIGNTSLLTITDTPTPGSVYWYKVVKVSGGVETKSRVVSVYVG